MYEYRYGSNADFDGYIEKFYTYEPFRYSISDAIISYCDSQEIVLNIDQRNREFLSLLLKCFFDLRELKIRNLRKIYKIVLDKKLPTKEYQTTLAYLYDSGTLKPSNQFINNPLITIDYNTYDFLKIIYILSIAFGGIDNLRNSISTLRNENKAIDTKYHQSIIYCLGIITHISIKLRNDDSRAFYNEIHYNNNSNIEIHYPQMSFLKKEIELPLFWAPSNKYQGGHYFVLRNEDTFIGKLQDANSLNMNSIMNWNNVADEILKIIDFVKKEHFFENTTQ